MWDDLDDPSYLTLEGLMLKRREEWIAWYGIQKLKVRVKVLRMRGPGDSDREKERRRFGKARIEPMEVMSTCRDSIWVRER